MIAVLLNINNMDFFSIFSSVCTYVDLTEIIGTFNLEKTNFQLAKKLKQAIIRSRSTEVPLKSTLGIVFHNQSFTFILLKTLFSVANMVTKETLK